MFFEFCVPLTVFCYTRIGYKKHLPLQYNLFAELSFVQNKKSMLTFRGMLFC